MRTLAFAATACLAGCAAFPTLEPGATTESQILATYGQPTRRWPVAEGATNLEYATQPMGISCFMFTIDSQGRLINARDALSDANLARVQVGMSKSDVDHILGRHAGEDFFFRSGQTVWDWNIPGFGPGMYTHFNVHFKDGIVVGASRDFIYGGGESGGMVIRPPAYLPCPRCAP